MLHTGEDPDLIRFIAFGSQLVAARTTPVQLNLNIRLAQRHS